MQIEISRDNDTLVWGEPFTSTLNTFTIFNDAVYKRYRVFHTKTSFGNSLDSILSTWNTTESADWVFKYGREVMVNAMMVRVPETFVSELWISVTVLLQPDIFNFFLIKFSGSDTI